MRNIEMNDWSFLHSRTDGPAGFQARVGGVLAAGPGQGTQKDHEVYRTGEFFHQRDVSAMRLATEKFLEKLAGPLDLRIPQ